MLNSPSIADAVKLTSSDPASPIAAMCKRHEGALYVFTVNMRNRDTTGTVEILEQLGNAKAHVLGEDRSRLKYATVVSKRNTNRAVSDYSKSAGIANGDA